MAARKSGVLSVMPAWLAPPAPRVAAPGRLIGKPRMSHNSREREGAAANGCTSQVTWRLRAIAHLEGEAGELRLRDLRALTGCSAKAIGSCLAKLQDKGLVKPTPGAWGRAYRWTGPT